MILSLRLIVKHAVLILLALLVTACSTHQRLESYNQPLEVKEQHLREFPNDQLVRQELFYLYIERYKGIARVEYLDSAIMHGEAYLQRQPDDDQIATTLYRIYQQRVIDNQYLVATNIRSDFDEMKRLYSHYPTIRHQKITPPTLLEAVHLASTPNAFSSDEMLPEVILLLKQALADEPSNTFARKMLAAAYTDVDQLEVAIYLYEEQLEATPDDVEALKETTLLYENLIYDDACPSLRMGRIDKALQRVKSLTQLAPDDSDAQALLTDLLRVKGRFTLSQFQAQKLDKVRAADEWLTTLPEALVWNGKVEEGIALLEQREQQYPNDPYLLETLAWFYLMDERWADLAALGKRYQAGDDSYAYAVLHISRGIEHENGTDAAKDYLSNMQASVELERWTNTLWQYQQHELSEDQLTAKAQDSCEMTEAKFAIGMRKWSMGEHQSAKAVFAELLALKIYPFIEYAIANSLHNKVN